MPATATAQTAAKSDDINAGVIAGIVIGAISAIFALLAVVIAGLRLLHIRKQQGTTVVEGKHSWYRKWFWQKALVQNTIRVADPTLHENHQISAGTAEPHSETRTP